MVLGQLVTRYLKQRGVEFQCRGDSISPNCPSNLVKYCMALYVNSAIGLDSKFLGVTASPLIDSVTS